MARQILVHLRFGTGEDDRKVYCWERKVPLGEHLKMTTHPSSVTCFSCLVHRIGELELQLVDAERGRAVP